VLGGDLGVRIVGYVRLGEDARVGQKTAILAYGVSPTAIGEAVAIDGRVTFHALDHSTYSSAMTSPLRATWSSTGRRR
jgi:carbonic anhydrase/acetyltransferase-like protein (isoleucine patch superfamily)